jgi:hypothetical protein
MADGFFWTTARPARGHFRIISAGGIKYRYAALMASIHSREKDFHCEIPSENIVKSIGAA